ncbi:MAG: hypothetical protein VXY81_02975, partial [Pseudomonadota bacterium]|nr:hypothetical protein [Pseudomonadota bacterium]
MATTTISADPNAGHPAGRPSGRAADALREQLEQSAGGGGVRVRSVQLFCAAPRAASRHAAPRHATPRHAMPCR